MVKGLVSLRFPMAKDAERFYEILNNPNFIYFSPVESLEAERRWIRGTKKRRQQNIEWNFTILYKGEVVGGVGIEINYHRPYTGEIGYFVDEKYWGLGIASEAVRLAEKMGFEKYGLERIEILMQPENKASEKVAVKNGYLKEGLLRNAIILKDKRKRSVWLYAKSKEEYLDEKKGRKQRGNAGRPERN